MVRLRKNNTQSKMIGQAICLEYDAEGGWIYSNNTLRYYQVTDEIAKWFSNNLKED